MAVYINTLNGGSITIGSGGSPAPVANPKTVVTLTNGETKELDFVGDVSTNTWESVGLQYGEDRNTGYEISSIVLGTQVTSLGAYFVTGWSKLNSVIIPSTVTSIVG